MSDTCSKSVSDGGRWPTFHDCGRPVKADGLCSLHLKVRDRRVEKDREMNDRFAASRRAEADVKAVCAELGIKGDPEYDHRTFGYTGQVVVSIETLRELAARR
jgi:hypothetical protein